MSSGSSILYTTTNTPMLRRQIDLHNRNGTIEDLHQRVVHYQAVDQGQPEWLSITTVTDGSPTSSLQVGEQPSEDSGLERKLFEFVNSQQIAEYRDTSDSDTHKDHVIVAVFITLQDESLSKRAAHDEWYNTEHIPMLSKVPGWLRTRRYVTCVGERKGEPTEYLALHEYMPENGLDGPEFKAATSTPWNAIIKKDCVKDKRRRVWQLKQGE